MGNLSFIGMGRLAAFAFVGVVGVGVTIDRNMNYTKTEGAITATETDCYVKSGKRELVSRTTNKRAYMACDEAPLAAAAFDYNDSDVHYRTKITYSYVSPIDKRTHEGDYEDDNSSSADRYKVGERYQVLAHKKVAGKSKWDYSPIKEAAAPAATSATSASVTKPAGLRGKL